MTQLAPKVTNRKGKPAVRRRRKVMGRHASINAQSDRQTASFFVRQLFCLRIKGGDVNRKSIEVKRQLLFS